MGTSKVAACLCEFWRVDKSDCSVFNSDMSFGEIVIGYECFRKPAIFFPDSPRDARRDGELCIGGILGGGSYEVVRGFASVLDDLLKGSEHFPAGEEVDATLIDIGQHFFFVFGVGCHKRGDGARSAGERGARGDGEEKGGMVRDFLEKKIKGIIEEGELDGGMRASPRGEAEKNSVNGRGAAVHGKIMGGQGLFDFSQKVQGGEEAGLTGAGVGGGARITRGRGRGVMSFVECVVGFKVEVSGNHIAIFEGLRKCICTVVP